VHVGKASAGTHSHAFHSPDAIAPLELDAVRHNRTFMFGHPD
jgi:hypothetical protein